MRRGYIVIGKTLIAKLTNGAGQQRDDARVISRRSASDEAERRGAPLRPMMRSKCIGLPEREAEKKREGERRQTGRSSAIATLSAARIRHKESKRTSSRCGSGKEASFLPSFLPSSPSLSLFDTVVLLLAPCLRSLSCKRTNIERRVSFIAHYRNTTA